METYHDNWNACLLFRNKQLTKQLKEYQNASVLAECSSSLLVSLGQLLRLHQNPSYGIIRRKLNGRICSLSLICFMAVACQSSYLHTG